ncbi:MAG: YceI family protein [Acidimicrobiia bacterium]
MLGTAEPIGVDVRLVLKILIAVLAVGLLAVGGLFAAYKTWWESDPEPRAEIEETEVTEGSELDGIYTVAPGPPEAPTFVGYRVTEQFAAAVVESTATGRTSDVTGSFTISGNTVSEVSVTANLLTLTSDRDQRDNAIKTRGLESERFPEATFVLTEPIELPAEPQLGETVDTTAVGDFTLHGVTKRVDIPVQGRWDGVNIQVVGNLHVVFADYGMEAPGSPLLASVDDEGEMEFQVFFQKT